MGSATIGLSPAALLGNQILSVSRISGPPMCSFAWIHDGAEFPANRVAQLVSSADAVCYCTSNKPRRCSLEYCRRLRSVPSSAPQYIETAAFVEA